MTSSNGSFFRATDTLCGAFTGHRRIVLRKGQLCGLWGILVRINKWLNERWFATTLRLCDDILMMQTLLGSARGDRILKLLSIVTLWVTNHLKVNLPCRCPCHEAHLPLPFTSHTSHRRSILHLYYIPQPFQLQSWYQVSSWLLRGIFGSLLAEGSAIIRSYPG